MKTMREMFKDLVNGVVDIVYGPEAQHQAGRGASELANMLFTGQGFVLYGHKDKNVEEKTPSPEVHNPEISEGREM